MSQKREALQCSQSGELMPDSKGSEEGVWESGFHRNLVLRKKTKAPIIGALKYLRH